MAASLISRRLTRKFLSQSPSSPATCFLSRTTVPIDPTQYQIAINHHFFTRNFIINRLFPSISEPSVADFKNNYSNSPQKALEFYHVKLSMANPNWPSIGKSRQLSTSSSTPGSRGPKVERKPRFANRTKQAMDSSDSDSEALLRWAQLVSLACLFYVMLMPSSWFFFYWYLVVFLYLVYLKK